MLTPVYLMVDHHGSGSTAFLVDLLWFVGAEKLFWSMVMIHINILCRLWVCWSTLCWFNWCIGCAVAELRSCWSTCWYDEASVGVLRSTYEHNLGPLSALRLRCHCAWKIAASMADSWRWKIASQRYTMLKHDYWHSMIHTNVKTIDIMAINIVNDYWHFMAVWKLSFNCLIWFYEWLNWHFMIRCWPLFTRQ